MQMIVDYLSYEKMKNSIDFFCLTLWTKIIVLYEHENTGRIKYLYQEKHRIKWCELVVITLFKIQVIIRKLSKYKFFGWNMVQKQWWLLKSLNRDFQKKGTGGAIKVYSKMSKYFNPN